MYTIILCGIILAIVGGITEWVDKKKNIWAGIFGAIAGTIIGCVVGCILFFIMGFILPIEYHHSYDIELVASKDVNGVSGAFFLGCGVVNSQLQYIYYYKDKEGNIKPGRLSAENDNVSLKEEGNSGIIKVYRREFRKKHYNKWGLEVFDRSYKFKIFVPKGSIATDFKFYLE